MPIIESIKPNISLYSLLSSRPHKKDGGLQRVRRGLNNSVFDIAIKEIAFPTQYQNADGSPVEGLLIRSSQSSYLIVRSKIAVNTKKGIDLKDAYAVISSPYPERLMQAFSSPNSSNEEHLSNDALRKSFRVLTPAFRAEDIETTAKDGSTYLIADWAKNAIEKYDANSRSNLRIHGTFYHDEEDGIFRSGSSIILVQENKDSSFSAKLFYNKYAYLGLYLKKKELQSISTKSYFSALTHTIPLQATSFEDAQEETRKMLARIGDYAMQQKDPFDLFKPETQSGQIKHLAATKAKRASQTLTNNIFNNYPLLVSFGMSVLLSNAMNISFLFAFGGKATFSTSIFKGITRHIGKLTSDNNIDKPLVLNDISIHFANHKSAKEGRKEEGKSYSLNPAYAKTNKLMRPVPPDMVSNIFLNIEDNSKDLERAWALAVLLDPLSCPKGTTFSEAELKDKTYLRARQPNGLDVYYDSFGNVAFAEKIREPDPGIFLEKPLANLFDSLPEGHNVVCVRRPPNEWRKSRSKIFNSVLNTMDKFKDTYQNFRTFDVRKKNYRDISSDNKENGGLEFISCENLANVPEDFKKGHMPASYQETEEQLGYSMNNFCPEDSAYPIKELLTPKQARALEKEQIARVSQIFEEALDDHRESVQRDALCRPDQQDAEDRLIQYWEGTLPEKKERVLDQVPILAYDHLLLNKD